MSLLNSYDVSRYVSACAKRAGMNVIWEMGGTPRTDGKTIWLPHYNAYDDRESMRIMNFVKHETSHVVFSDFSLLEEKKPEGLLMSILNLLEDHRVDWLNDTEFDGDRLNEQEYINDTTARIPDVVGEEERTKMIPLHAWDLIVRRDLYDVDPTKLVELSDSVVLKNLLPFSDDLRSIRTIADPRKGGEEVYELACRILKEVFGGDPTAKPEKKGKGDESGEDSDSEGSGGVGEEGEGKEGAEGDKAGDDDGKSDKGGVDKGDAKPKFIDYKGKEITPRPCHTPSGGVNATGYTLPSRKAYTPTPPEKVALVDYVNNVTKNIRRPTPHAAYRRIIMEKVTGCTTMANVLRTKLQVFSRDRWEYGKKKGKLHASSLYRIKAGGEGMHRVFKEQIHNYTDDVAIQLLVDASGSMSGTKFVNASAAAIVLSNTLSNVLHFPVEVLAFTEWSSNPGSPMGMFVHKEFDKRRGMEQMAEDFSCTGTCLHDNVDGESLVYGYHRLKQRKEKRKIMIVLSDGSPCGGGDKGDTDSHTIRVIKEIEKSGVVELMGVGIEYDQVKYYYKAWDVIEDSRNIEASLIRILDRKLFK